MPSVWQETNYPVSSRDNIEDARRQMLTGVPGQWEFVKKGDPAVVGITKLDGVTLEDLKRPRRQIAPPELLEASSPTSVTEPASTSEASRMPGQ